MLHAHVKGTWGISRNVVCLCCSELPFCSSCALGSPVPESELECRHCPSLEGNGPFGFLHRKKSQELAFLRSSKTGGLAILPCHEVG